MIDRRKWIGALTGGGPMRPVLSVLSVSQGEGSARRGERVVRRRRPGALASEAGP